MASWCDTDASATRRSSVRWAAMVAIAAMAVVASLAIAGRASAATVVALDLTNVPASQVTTAGPFDTTNKSKATLLMEWTGQSGNGFALQLRPCRPNTSAPLGLATTGGPGQIPARIANQPGASGTTGSWIAQYELAGIDCVFVYFQNVAGITSSVKAWLQTEAVPTAGSSTTIPNPLPVTWDTTHPVTATVANFPATQAVTCDTCTGGAAGGTMSLDDGDRGRLDLVWIGIFLLAGMTLAAVPARKLAAEVRGWGGGT